MALLGLEGALKHYYYLCGTNPVWLYMVLYDNVATNVLLPGAWLLYCDNQRWHCTLVTQPDGLVAGDHAWVPHD
jgi:hypothetical protein